VVTPSVERADTTASADLVQGQILIVRLPAQGGTESNWTIVSSPDKVVTSQGRRTEPEAVVDVSEKVGGTEWQTFRFKAQQSGTTTVRFAYGRPWEQTAETSKRLSLTINVTP
jgi:inhibitor of cysteine peptidase